MGKLVIINNQWSNGSTTTEVVVDMHSTDTKRLLAQLDQEPKVQYTLTPLGN